MKKTLPTDKRQPTAEELAAASMAGTIQGFGQRIVNAGGFPLLQRGIDDPQFILALLDFHRNYVPSGLGYAAILKWFQENGLEEHLDGGSLEKQIRSWEIFYRRFYGKKFQLDRSKILVDARRLLAIKVGLENEAVNSALIEVVPTITEAEQNLTEAEYFFRRILKSTGINIWAETSRERWTGKNLDEVLAGYIPVLPEDFDPVALKKNCIAECNRVARKKESAPRVSSGIMRLSFVNNRQDIPSRQKYVSQVGEIVKVQYCSFTSAIEKNVKVVTPAQEILLTAKMFSDTGEYLARKTWEFNSALLKHEEKNPNVSVAIAGSNGSKFNLRSDAAGCSFSGSRWRLAL
jgi:hypothetical protein